MRNADIALYEAKKRGRDRARLVLRTRWPTRCSSAATIELELRDAIERDSCELHYQPIVSCATNRDHGVEALLRWRHPEQGRHLAGECSFRSPKRRA